MDRDVSSGEGAEDVRFLHDEHLFTVDGDLGAGPLAEENAVARFHVGRDAIAIFLARAFANGDDFALGRLFLGAVGDDQAALGLLVTFDTTDENAVVQGVNAI